MSNLDCKSDAAGEATIVSLFYMSTSSCTVPLPQLSEPFDRSEKYSEHRKWDLARVMPNSQNARARLETRSDTSYCVIFQARA